MSDKRRLNIAFIVSMKYGLTQFIFRDIEALKKQGHDVKLFSLLDKPGLYRPLPDWEVVVASRWASLVCCLKLLLRRPIFFLQLFRSAWSTSSLANLAVAAQFAPQMNDREVIYSYFGDHKLFAGYYCKRITDIPLVVTIRAYELYRNPNPLMFREALQLCDSVVTITEHNKEQLVDRYGVESDKIDIVRQIVDLDRYKFKSTIKILIVGFFAEKKGHEILFRAIKRLQRDDVELWVVGDLNPSINQTDCRQLAKDLEIESQVAFFGQQRGTALRALYGACDVFCLPSRKDSFGDHEGFPNVIAEAMAFSKPVVTTRHAGIPEAVDALLVDENDVEQLAAALREVCDNAELRQQLGERNRLTAEQMFSEANSNRLAQILQSHSHKSQDASNGKPSQSKAEVVTVT